MTNHNKKLEIDNGNINELYRQGMYYEIGRCYEHKIGVKRNLTSAYLWYQKAAKNGDENAKKRRNQIREKFMTTTIWLMIVSWHLFLLVTNTPASIYHHIPLAAYVTYVIIRWLYNGLKK